MMRNLAQEWLKVKHQKSFYYGILMLFGLMLFTVLMDSDDQVTFLIVQGFGASQWIALILVVFSANRFALEYQNNTLLTLFYKNPTKRPIYWAKLMIILGYSGMLHISSIGFTILIKWLFYPNQYAWFSTEMGNQSLLETFLKLTGTNFMASLLIIAFAICLICLFKVNVIAISIGVGIVFLGQTVSAGLLQSAGDWVSLFKWNPFNMLNLLGQVADPSFNAITKLSDVQIMMGTAVYSLLFLSLGYQLFKRSHN